MRLQRRCTERGWLVLLSCLLGGLVVAAPVARAVQPSGEELVKAELIERFTRFIDWPASVLGQGQPQFVICIAGSGPVADRLPQAAPDEFKKRPPVFRRIGVGEDLSACHLLFIGATDAGQLSALLASVAGRPILTVADTEGAGERGVMINLYRQGARISFEINRAAAQRSPLKISARLLQLARMVGPKLE